MGILDLLDAAAETECAALRHGGASRGDKSLATELADKCVGGGGRQPHESGKAQELAAIDLAFGKLGFQQVDMRILDVLSHFLAPVILGRCEVCLPARLFNA